MVSPKSSSSSIGLVALVLAAFSAEDLVSVSGFVSPPRGTRVSLTSTPSLSGSSLRMSIFGDDSRKSDDMESTTDAGRFTTDQYKGVEGAIPSPNDVEVPETRQLRWEREAFVQSKFASGDELFQLRLRIVESRQELIDAQVRYNDSKGRGDRVATQGRIDVLEKELHDMNERDAEFMYALSSELMESAETSGDIEGAEKYRVQMEEARLCIPQLNMHGLWVGKYGDHGYEMINVTYSGDTLIATKVTGDKNVPKGEITFTADLTPRISTSVQPAHATHLEPIELDEKAQRQWGKKYLPRYLGKGQVASENFNNAQWMEGQMILVGRFFSFAWVPIGHQIFFGRPSSELTIKMLREAREEEFKCDHVAVMRDVAHTMMEETHWVEREEDSYFMEDGCFE